MFLSIGKEHSLLPSSLKFFNLKPSSNSFGQDRAFALIRPFDLNIIIDFISNSYGTIDTNVSLFLKGNNEREFDENIMDSFLIGLSSFELTKKYLLILSNIYRSLIIIRFNLKTRKCERKSSEQALLDEEMACKK